MFEKMKTFGGKVANKVKDAFSRVECDLAAKGHAVLDGTKAEAYVDTGVKILIAVVIGAVLMAGLYALFRNVIMPTAGDKVSSLFDAAPGLEEYANANGG